jgi:protein tyrosine/serine phosphatase
LGRHLDLAFLLAITLLPLRAPAEPGDALPAAASASRPADWAVKIERAGLPNLYQVTTNLYRGAQPTRQGMAELKQMGVKTVVNLRNYHSDEVGMAGTGLEQDHLNMAPWHATDEESVRFLKVVTDTNKLPVFVHCQRGADRTGTLCAVYRVVVCNWSRDKAIREMTEGGFGFNPAWQNLVNYVRKLDVEKLRRESGLKPDDRTSRSIPGTTKP